MRKVIAILLCCATLIALGCAHKRPQNAAPPRQIICSKGEECEVRWGRSVAWVSQNSYWKMRNQTDALIETEGPLDSPNLAYSITKTPLGGGKYEIGFSAGCGNMFGCVPDAYDAREDFTTFVLAVPVTISSIAR